MAKRRTFPKFFRSTKTMDNQEVTVNQTDIGTTVNTEEFVTPTEEVQGASQPVVAEDRSAFNCVACQGEGLKDEQTLCPNCNGTGKVA